MSAVLLPAKGKNSSEVAYCQRAEESVCGYFLYRPEAFPKCRLYLNVDSFFSPGARNVFTVLCDLDDGATITLEAVAHRIEKPDFYTLADALCYCAMNEVDFILDLIHVRSLAARREREVGF